jgi:hypothetical protein
MITIYSFPIERDGTLPTITQQNGGTPRLIWYDTAGIYFSALFFRRIRISKEARIVKILGEC